MAGLFGTSGIRGIYGKEVTASLAMRTGGAAGKKGGKLIIARDARSTSPLLANAIAAGAMLSGAGVVDIGMAPTPLLAYATAREKCNGAMVTASHNPPEYNGIKLFSCGSEFTRSQEAEVEAAIAGKESAVAWNEAGQKESKDYAQEYAHFLLPQVDTPSIAGRKPRVLVDAGNAAASILAPALLRAAGCEVVELYCSEPGKPGRDLEPKAETLTVASEAVKKNRCDLGIAFDGDGDRAIGIDEKGRVLALDVQLAIFCAHFLKKKKGAIVSTVEASLCVKETVEKAGGRLSITPVGSLFVAEQVKKQGAVFGGEPCGEYVFPSSTPCADGLLSALCLAEIFCTKGRLSALADGVKTYPIERRKYGCGGKSKERIMAELAGGLAFPEAKLSTIDGLRYDFSDGWLLVRPSGTEPAMRLTCEFKGKKKLDETVAAAEKAILAAIA
ncbi:MAG: phosphoglucosamine mutase [Candidatus Micrarchaeota archaeon]|nr:phosphoglucosamine mutase [Candidatus Micrarchaeota archaeon]